MKLTYYLKVGFKLWLVNFIAGAVVIIPAMMFVLPSLGLSIVFNQDASISSFISGIYLILLPIMFTVQGFALYKYRNWVFK